MNLTTTHLSSTNSTTPDTNSNKNNKALITCYQQIPNQAKPCKYTGGVCRCIQHLNEQCTAIVTAYSLRWSFQQQLHEWESRRYARPTYPYCYTLPRQFQILSLQILWGWPLQKPFNKPAKMTNIRMKTPRRWNWSNANKNEAYLAEHSQEPVPKCVANHQCQLCRPK